MLIASEADQLGVSLRARAAYPQAEQLFCLSLSIRKNVLGPEHVGVATSLNNLAVVLKDQGEYAKAEPLYQRAEDANVATCLNNLAVLYADESQYTKAEPLYERALAIWEKALGPEHPDVATGLNNLARLYMDQGSRSRTAAGVNQ